MCSDLKVLGAAQIHNEHGRCNAGGAEVITEMERVARLFPLLVTSVTTSLALPWGRGDWKGCHPPSVPGEKLTRAWWLSASLSVG